jgi:DNA (cytosine-5)-methyltransferase 1
MPTQSQALVTPFLLPQQQFDRKDADSVDEPIRTIKAQSAEFDLVPTVTSHGAGGVAQPIIVKTSHSKGNGGYQRPINDPLYTISTEGGMGLVEPYLVQYNGTGKANSVSRPLGTLTGKPRFGLVTPLGLQVAEGLYLDIRFRMLRTHELAAAMGFPAGYKFAGDLADITKQIGNAIAVEQAEALCMEMLE